MASPGSSLAFGIIGFVVYSTHAEFDLQSDYKLDKYGLSIFEV
jgi:hypothetical protein